MSPLKVKDSDADISQEIDVVAAQNTEVNAQIDFLDAVSRLDRSRGIILKTWQAQVKASGILR